MVGKSKQQKKKRAKMKKQIKVEQNQQQNIIKATILDETAQEPELGNNAEPAPANINEDAQKDAEMVAEEPPVPTAKQITSYEKQKREDAGESEPFDPKKLVDDMLKKHGA